MPWHNLDRNKLWAWRKCETSLGSCKGSSG